MDLFYLGEEVLKGDVLLSNRVCLYCDPFCKSKMNGTENNFCALFIGS